MWEIERRERQRQAMHDAIHLIGPVGDGVVLRHEERASWAVLIRDASACGKWRMQRFNRNGFGRHACYDDATQALHSAMAHGYTVRDDRALDSLFATPRFQRGLARDQLDQLSEVRRLRERRAAIELNLA